MTTVLVGTQVQLRAYLASTNSSQMDFHIDVRNDCKKFTVFMWKVSTTGANRQLGTFDDQWCNRTAGRDIFRLPMWGAAAPAAPRLRGPIRKCLGGV